MKLQPLVPWLLGATLCFDPSGAVAQTLDWNAKTQGDFVFALAQGSDGFWVTTEDQGIWRRSADGWKNFTTADGLGDNTGLCMVRRGSQIWVGHATGGLSIWDGAKWTNLSVEDGLPSERVATLSVNQNNDVWLGTENGLLRWSDADGWLVPGSPLCRRAIAGVATAGDLVVAATACEGLLLSSDGGVTWQEVRGPQFQPVTPTGTGLPSDVLNDVKIDTLGQIWVATDTGFARSSDAGKTWFYVRGADWKANIEGTTLGLRPRNAALDVDLASEDWVQTLTPTKDGKIWLGFRQKGAELRDCRTGEALFSSMDDRSAAHTASGDWVRSICPLPGDRALIANYAGGVVGLLRADFPAAPPEVEMPQLKVPTPLPTLDASALERLVQAKVNLGGALPAGSAVWESLDWRTKGDWVGRYGDRYAQGYSPWAEKYSRTPAADFKTRLGPHLAPNGKGPYTYYTKASPEERRALYFPAQGERRMGELNDGTWQSDLYPFSWEGPDLWVETTVPQGAHRLSFYFANNDGRGAGLGRFRDYIVSLREFRPDIKDADQAPDLARARIRDAAPGGYVRFSVMGPAKFWLKIARHRSNVTKINGLFFDAINEGQYPALPMPQPAEPALMPWMGGVRYTTEPTPAHEAPENETINTARRAWYELDNAALRVGGLEGRWQERLQIYRAAKAAGASEKLLANWRWKLTIWRDGDRETFDATMKEARAKQLALQETNKPKVEAAAP